MDSLNAAYTLLGENCTISNDASFFITKGSCFTIRLGGSIAIASFCDDDPACPRYLPARKQYVATFIVFI